MLKWKSNSECNTLIIELDREGESW